MISSQAGQSTREEICLAFLLYYPKIPLVYCLSEPTPQQIFGSLGIEMDEYVHGKKIYRDCTEDGQFFK